METLIDELVIYILSYLDAKSLLQLRQISHKFYNLSYDNLLWKDICKSSPTLLFKNSFPERNWEWVVKSQVFKPQRQASTIGSAEYGTGVYSGDWFVGSPHGYGFFKSCTWTYVGQWSNGQKEGKGIKRYYDGETTDGLYENDEHIYAIKYYRNGDTYDGEWKDFVRQGYGEYSWIIGDKYVGEWTSGNLHGFGIYYWADKRQYTGEWFNHNQSGFGIFEWPTTYYFEGYWKKGKRHGYGKLINIDTNEVLYAGEFINDVAVGDKNLIWNGYFAISFNSQRILIEQMKLHPTYTYWEVLRLVS